MSDAARELMKPGRGMQAQWLSKELLHSAPSAHLVSLKGKPAAQLEHPGGGPLTCVSYPGKGEVIGVERHNGQWHWLVRQA